MSAQGVPPEHMTDDLLRDTVDLHYHSGPSPFPRRLDPVESARHYDEHGFKAVVYKSHHHNTVMDILSIKTSVLDQLRVRVFGGVALNGLVCGLNPRAVELCLRMGGKVVIQAKRYKNTVGVAAVRDLFGTVHNEGASKGILVTTSGYGKAAFDFANGKPLELLSGVHLLHLLEQHAGVKARIEVPDDWVDPIADSPPSEGDH